MCWLKSNVNYLVIPKRQNCKRYAMSVVHALSTVEGKRETSSVIHEHYIIADAKKNRFFFYNWMRVIITKWVKLEFDKVYSDVHASTYIIATPMTMCASLVKKNYPKNKTLQFTTYIRGKKKLFQVRNVRFIILDWIYAV